jgi:hypothetical protein
MKKTMKKLTLTKETVRRLEAHDDLRHVEGGSIEAHKKTTTTGCTVDTGCTHC